MHFVVHENSSSKGRLHLTVLLCQFLFRGNGSNQKSNRPTWDNESSLDHPCFLPPIGIWKYNVMSRGDYNNLPVASGDIPWLRMAQM